MKTVYILRHAKSDWGDPAVKDHERPLNERGRSAAPQMGAHLKAKKYKPDLVLCSTARRTVETYELIKPFVGARTPVVFEDALYLAEARQIGERLRWLDEDVGAVMVIGHNPGLAQLAMALSAAAKTADDAKLHERMREKFSTCALAVIELGAKSWREVKMGTGTLKDFMRPKDL